MNIISMTSQDGLQQVAIHAVVVDDEDLDHSHPCGKRCATPRHGPSLAWGLGLESKELLAIWLVGRNTKQSIDESRRWKSYNRLPLLHTRSAVQAI